jgi:ABC-type amino acid transport substrate-binding protein
LHFAEAIKGLHYRGSYEGTNAAYAMMFAKGNDALQQEINAVLLILETEDVMDGIRSRWFKKPSILIP